MLVCHGCEYPGQFRVIADSLMRIQVCYSDAHLLGTDDLLFKFTVDRLDVQWYRKQIDRFWKITVVVEESGFGIRRGSRSPADGVPFACQC